MAIAFPLQLLRGPFHFLRPDADEVGRLFPDIDRTLPPPRPIFLDEEEATPVDGFAVLIGGQTETLRSALTDYVLAEELVQTAVFARAPHDRRDQETAWRRYRELLGRAIENSTLSSYGRSFPAVFWLFHSLDLARLLQQTPRRVVRHHLEVGRRHGDAIRYRVLERYLDRVMSATYDLVTDVATETEDVEEELFPRLLTRLRDNVLLLTEDHVSHDLAELAGYFNGYLGLDGRDLRRRLDALEAWHRERLVADDGLAAMVHHLLLATEAPEAASRALLVRPGYARYLAGRPDYRAAADRLPTAQQVEVWESLLVKLKEFELVHALRRMILPVVEEGRERRLVSRGPVARALTGQQEVALSPATRPMDFMAPWVVDPEVFRFGMIYDITDFSELVALFRRSGTGSQDESFRALFRLQRLVNRIAAGRRMKLEKYLGDGAFYSGRQALRALTAAIQVQRTYRQAVAEGFAFDRGMRVALNYGQYRLIPIAIGQPGAEERYEFFGQGVIELSRLTTGKTQREIEDMQAMLINRGYPENAVHRFLAPLLQRRVDENDDRSRAFRAFLARDGSLVNEGIVATDAFLRELAREIGARPLARYREGDRGYVVVEVADGAGTLPVGLRKLGVVTLKGLDPVTLYELVDAEPWGLAGLEPLVDQTLVSALERELVGALTGGGS
ncbi:MAG TPA: hypothetical protein VHQ65_04390 [Thermoanaerobaculia bacterium]|nr:hypothetical protein [Thermoanaerobaculia bacterium]